LFDLFIVNGIKVVPHNIFELLCPIALAHWAMCDGSRGTGGGFILCTDSFTIQDVVRLINVLIIKYNLNCSIQYYNGLPRIYIYKNQFNKFKSIVAPHFYLV
jgi:LAGLIDADG DNA endonuclease family